MEISYTCSMPQAKEIHSWEGLIRILNISNPCETEVFARGTSFHMLIGRHTYGNYLCVPNYGIGTELAALDDSFWNYEKLVNSYPGLSDVDARSIVGAITALSDYITL